MGSCCLTPFSVQYFSYIMVVSCIGGGNRSTRRKPPTCRKSMTNLHCLYHILYNVVSSTSRHERERRGTLSRLNISVKDFKDFKEILFNI